MKDTRLLKNAEEIKLLAKRLSECAKVSRYDTKDYSEGWTLAHAFSDLEESFARFLEDQLPRLTRGGLGPDGDYQLLLDIGEELRHILYHIGDPHFYRYLRSKDT